MTEPHAEDTFDDDIDIEAPEADVIEQHTSTRRDEQPAAYREPPFEADAADAAEQDVEADVDDEDEYR